MRITFLLISAYVLSGVVACQQTAETTLPILGSREPVTKVVDGKTVTDKVYHSIADFRLLNQDSVFIDNHTFDDGVYIANFFFTPCPSICPTMQRNLLKVYEKYKGDERVRFLSLSIAFRYDSPSVLKAYADKLGVTNEQWQFVTGSKRGRASCRKRVCQEG